MILIHWFTSYDAHYECVQHYSMFDNQFWQTIQSLLYTDKLAVSSSSPFFWGGGKITAIGINPIVNCWQADDFISNLCATYVDQYSVAKYQYLVRAITHTHTTRSNQSKLSKSVICAFCAQLHIMNGIGKWINTINPKSKLTSVYNEFLSLALIQ